MNKIKIKPKLTLYLGGFLIISLLASGLFFKSILLPDHAVVEEKTPEVLGQSIIASPSSLPSPSPSLLVKVLAKASSKPSIKPSAVPSVTPTPIPSGNPSPSAQPSLISSPSSAAGSGPVTNSSGSPSSSLSPSPSPPPSATASTVNLEIQGSIFSVEISGDLNVCQVLERAKDQGKISSLTLDDSYMSSMHSLYVKEMNGLSNNWTFKVNGNSPLGCSLYQVKPGDQIVFKFG